MRVTVAAWIGSSNAGDELIFAALRAKLRARGARVVALAAQAGHAGDDTTYVPHLAPRRVASAVRAGDALLFGGGGLLQDQTSWFNLPFHLSRLEVARRAGTPRGVVAVGVGPLRTAAGRAQVRRALRGVRPVSVRDPASRHALRRLGVNDVRVAADLALSLPAPEVAAADAITACLRPWRAARGRLPVALRAGRDHTPEWAVTRLAAGLDDAARALGLPVRLVALQRGWDDVLHRRVAARMRADVTLHAPPPDRVLDEIAASRVVVAMRYHAGIAALLAGRPAVLIGYDPKVAGLATAMGPGATLLGWDGADLARVGTATTELAQRGVDLGPALAELRTRERENDAVIDDVLALAEARR